MVSITKLANKFDKDRFKEFSRKLGRVTASSLMPNTKSVFDTNASIVKENFKLPEGLKNMVDDGKKNGGFMKSFKKTISDNLNEIKNNIKEGNSLGGKDETDDLIDSILNDDSTWDDDGDSSITDAVSDAFNDNDNDSVGTVKPIIIDKRKTITNVTGSYNSKKQDITNQILLTSIKANLQAQKESTSAILSNMSAITTFQQETTLNFYNDVSDKLASIHESINTMSKVYAETAALEMSSTESLYNAILNDGLSIGTMGKLLKNNVSNKLPFFNKGTFDLLKSSLATMDPQEMIMQFMIGKLMPGKVKDSIKKFDDNINNLPVNLQYMFNNWAKGGNRKFNILGKDVDIFQKIGKAFGMDLKPKSEISTGKYNKGPMAYNGRADRAITTVIPSLLSKILSAVTKNENYKDELIYDYEKGQFTNKKRVNKDYNRRMKESATSAFFDSDIEKMLGDLAKAKDGESEKDTKKRIQKYSEEIDRIILTLAKEGKTLSDYQSVTGDKELDKQLKKFYGDALNKGDFNKKIFEATRNLDKFYESFSNVENLAGQVAMDYSKNPYGKKNKRFIDKKDNNSFENMEEFLSSLSDDLGLNDDYTKLGKIKKRFKDRKKARDERNSQLANSIDSLTDKLNNLVSENQGINKEIYEESDDTFFGDLIVPSRRKKKKKKGSNGKATTEATINTENSKVNDILKLLQSHSEDNAFRVKIIGGSLDNVRSIIKTKEEVKVDANKNYKDQLAAMKDEFAEDAAEMEGKNALADEAAAGIKERTDAYKERKKDFDAEVRKAMGLEDQSFLNQHQKQEELKAQLLDKFENSKYGQKISNTIDKGKSAVKDKLTNKFNNTKFGKKYGKKIGKYADTITDIFKNEDSGPTKEMTVDDIVKQGMTPVWIMGSNIGGLGGGSGKAVSLDKLKDKAEESIEDGSSFKDDILEYGNKAKNLTTKGLNKGSKLLGKLSGKGGKIGKVAGKGSELLSKGSNFVEGITADGIKSVAKGALSKAGSMAGSIAGSLGGTLSSAAGAAGSALGGVGSAIAGGASAAGGAIAGIAGSVGPALAGLAPVLGPAAVAALGTAAIVKFGPKIIKGVGHLAGKAVEGIKGLGKNIGKGLKTAGKTALGVGKKILEYSPLGLAGKGLRAAGGWLKDKFTGGDKEDNPNNDLPETEDGDSVSDKAEKVKDRKISKAEATTLGKYGIGKSLPENSDINMTNSMDKMFGKGSDITTGKGMVKRLRSKDNNALMYGSVKSLLLENDGSITNDRAERQSDNTSDSNKELKLSEVREKGKLIGKIPSLQSDLY